MKYACMKGGMMNDDVDEESQEIEQQLADFTVHLDERYDELMSVVLPLTREDRTVLLELLESLEGFLNIVNEGAEPFENLQKQDFFRNKVNNLIRIIRIYLNYSTPQPKRPINLPNPKPRRGAGIGASLSLSNEEKIYLAESRLREVYREVTHIFNQIVNTPTQSQLERLSVLSDEIDDLKEYIENLKI